MAYKERSRMSIFWCDFCKKEIQEADTLKQNEKFYCPICLHRVYYFGSEKAYLTKKARGIKLTEKITAEYVQFPQVLADPIVDLNILQAEDSLLHKPDNYLAMNALGVYYLSQKNLKLAEKWFNQALEINPEHVQTKLNLINLYMAQKDYDKALQELVVLKEKEPQNYFITYNMGIVYYQKGDLFKAQEYFRDVIEKSDNEQLKERVELYLKKLGKMSQL